MNGNCRLAVGVGMALGMLFAVSPAHGGEAQALQEVSPAVVEKPQDSLVLYNNGAPETVAAMRSHQLTVGGKPGGDGEVHPLGWKTQCEWMMPTPRAGDYVVSLFMVSGDKRPGKFGFYSGATKIESDEFHEKGKSAACWKSFRIVTPAGQEQTKMFLAGDGIALRRVDLSPVTRPIENPDGVIRQLAESSYRTVLRAPAERPDAPSCLILAPHDGVEARLARELADALKIRLVEEPELSAPFPQYPASQFANADTNLILLSAGTGGPIVQAMRRAGMIAENLGLPGEGGYELRTVARPFNGKANVIVISGGGEDGLAKGVRAFQPALDSGTGELVWDRFLVDMPGERWAKLRPAFYHYAKDDPFWDRELTALKQPFGGAHGLSPGRAFLHETGMMGTQYWLTGNDRFAELFKQRMFKMEKEGVYGWVGADGEDSHMELYGLIRGWVRVEESPVFTKADRLRITNFLLHHCVLGDEGFLRAYNGYGQYSGPAALYTGPIRMRHNHQTILGLGLMHAYVYFSRLYGIGCADMWKSWCDDLIHEATAWGHGPENSFHYELKVPVEVADMLHCQGLSAAGQECSSTWLATAARFMAARGSLGVPACYGDCGDGMDYETMDPDRWDFFGAVMRDDFAWPPAQFAIDQMIRGYRCAAPSSGAAGEYFAYLNGSTDVGGVFPPPSPAAREMARQMSGLHAYPMGEGFWRYRNGLVGQEEFWAAHRRPEPVPYSKTAEKVVYRSGWDIGDEYMMLGTLGWTDHAHMELGAIVQYCQGGRLWVVENGYDNTAPEYCSTLEVKRDGKPAWDNFNGWFKRWGEFRSGPQMLEIVQLEQGKPRDGQPGAGPFHLVCRAKDLAGATWLRAISGGDGQGLRIEDTLTADEPGEYQMVFRLRLLGRVEGEKGKWQVTQKGAVLPITLEIQDGDSAAAAWIPPTASSFEGPYPWYTFIQGIANPGQPVSGAPRTLEWKRTVRLDRGQTTVLRATLGPSEKTGEPERTK